MGKQSRTKNSIKNIVFSLGGYVITSILQLVVRSVFLNKLSAEYLGLGGLFSNILSMLALSELGVGTAMIYALYRPIAEDNREKIKSLMSVYKKMYTFIGVFIFIAGMAVTPFLKHLIKDMPDIPNIRQFFLLYVLNSAFSYFCTYKRSLIICNQKEYISSTTTSIAAIVLRIIQILILIFTGSYLFYLIAQVVMTIGENLFVSWIADKIYPYLKERNIEKLPSEDVRNLKKNIFAMFGHKLGNVIVNATDNLILSKILGLVSVGLFSNYELILTNVKSIFVKVFNALNASVGNLTVASDKKHSEDVLDSLVILAYLIMNTLVTGLFVLFQDFIVLWIGEEYLLSTFSVGIILLNFYISNMRIPVMTFRNATGTFWNDRYKPLFESVVNLVISIPLTYALGVAGVKLGTILSTLLVAFWVEAYVLYKHYFQKSVLPYLLKQAKLLALTIFCTALAWGICSFINGTTIVGFAIKGFISLFVPIGVNLAFFWRSKEIKFLVSKFRHIFNRRHV